MLYTLAHAKDLVASFVLSGGSCPSAQVVKDRINEAQRRLLTEGKADWASTQRHLRIRTCRSCLSLPREFETARLIAVNCGPAYIFPMSYQYLENGPGPESADGFGDALEDMGDGWPAMFDLPDDVSGLKLFAVSTSLDDTKLVIRAFGKTADGSEVLRSSGLPGFDLSIRQWARGVEGSLVGYPEVSSDVSVASISQIVLPEGRKGYVSLYAVNETTHEMYFLSKYHPAETTPSYRRYRVLRGIADTESTVQILAKLRHVPLSQDDDVLLIQNLDAIKTMVMAIREENAGNISAALALEERANQQLARQMANKRSGDPIIQVQEIYGIGGSPNII